MRKQKDQRPTSHVVRDDDGNEVDVSKALLDALVDEGLPEGDGDDELREGSKQTGEMTVLVKMAKNGRFTPRTEYEMGACQMLKVRGYATTKDNKRFSPTPTGKARALELKPSLRFGKF